MPKVYKCFNCDKIFPYTIVSVGIRRGKNRIAVEIPCKQPTFGELGSTGHDYVCGDCIRTAITEEGIS